MSSGPISYGVRKTLTLLEAFVSESRDYRAGGIVDFKSFYRA